MEKYNGWVNRSTWLVQLHLSNTSKEVADLYHNAAVTANTLKQFKNRVLFLMPHVPLLSTEEQFFLNEIDWGELWDANRITI
jgi:hypothetical protein